MTTYFENLTAELYVFYVLKTHVEFYVNWMLLLFDPYLFFSYNFRLQKLEN